MIDYLIDLSNKFFVIVCSNNSDDIIVNRYLYTRFNNSLEITKIENTKKETKKIKNRENKINLKLMPKSKIT